MRTIYAIIVGMALLFAAVPAAQAAEVGASGQCYDEDANGNRAGGDDRARVSTDGTVGGTNVVLLDIYEPLDGGDANPVQSPGEEDGEAVEAVVTLALGAALNGNPPQNNCDAPDTSKDRKDYLEVHVITSDLGGADLQVCYDGSPQVSMSSGSFACSTDAQPDDSA